MQEQRVPVFCIHNQVAYTNWDERSPVRAVCINHFDVRGCEIQFIANWVDYNRTYTRTTCKQNMLDYIEKGKLNVTPLLLVLSNGIIINASSRDRGQL